MVCAEVALVFLVFFIQGASPVPEVNEPNYLCKALHYWNPSWCHGDFFLESADSHTVFYFTFGWLALWLSPLVLAWFGRLLTWALLAWAWQRLSYVLIPRCWMSVLTAGLWVCLIETNHMAGEWVIGGVEAKGFAYVLVLLGLEALARARWNRMFILFGAAAAFHVLIGGWSVVAGGVAWLCAGESRPSVRSLLPGLIVGGLLSLPGLLPTLMLNSGTDRAVVAQAHQLYVYTRLPHHLNVAQIPAVFIRRFVILTIFWAAIVWATSAGERLRRIHTFVLGTVVLALIGGAMSALSLIEKDWAAVWLRFYWFRLSDAMVPLGVAMAVGWFAVEQLKSPSWVGRVWLGLVIAVVAIHVGSHAVERVVPVPPPGFRLVHRWASPAEDYVAWRKACDWIANSGKIPADARFLTPRMAQTFKWYAQRPEVVNWKELPQDAEAIVEWWQRLLDIHSTGSGNPREFWFSALSLRSPRQLQELGQRYDAQYVITAARPRLDLPEVYRNRVYAVYRLTPPSVRAKEANGVLPQSMDEAS